MVLQFELVFEEGDLYRLDSVDSPFSAATFAQDNAGCDHLSLRTQRRLPVSSPHVLSQDQQQWSLSTLQSEVWVSSLPRVKGIHYR
jgi:hypothetical protein